ncbi:nucleotidyl transferase AbiEii/AbiGii toxin family protein [bacterium]|nr:nucleotidyl transferase AbiEii/AbiGii toxin family protein [bacterium]
MKADVKNLEASVRAKLQNKAKETGCSFSEILQYFGMERFLYRFSQSQYADKFILKGALTFIAWQVTERRATRDIDFLARFDNQVESIEKIIKDICVFPVLPDGLEFDAATVKGRKIKEDADYEGVRVKFLVFLDRARIAIQVDVGFGDVICPKPKAIDYPVILDFPRPRLKVYPAESVISEKFEAMVKLGLLNSRMKDFYDIWLMLRQFEFDGSKLAQALNSTFSHRKTSLPIHKPIFDGEIYDERSDRQTLWKAFLEKEGIRNAPEKLRNTAAEIEKFLIKPLEAIGKGREFKKTWHASGPWR